MSELNKIRFLLIVSLMIFSACALDVILSGAHEDFKQKSEIIIDIVNGTKTYGGTLNQLTYRAELGIFKVIVYIIRRSRCIEILRPAGVAREIRSHIAQELGEIRCELVFLGIENFDDDEYHLIGAFMLDKIRPHPDRPDLIIETIGENRFDHFYGYHVMNFEKYQENAQICGGTLLARLRSIPHGALKPIGSNKKAIRLWGYQPWTEVDIVTQIILKHSEGLQSSVYNVFTCGYGMFNTYYLYVYAGEERYIRKQPNSYVSEVIRVLMEEEVKERAINVYYLDNEWKGSHIPINLGNGQYIPEFRFNNFTLPRLFQKIAFIVYDRAEMSNLIDYAIVGECMGKLGQSGTGVVFIEAINFGLDDMHIIAEWMDRHSGVIDLEEMAVLGGGIFDTIFQSEFTTYNTFLNTGKNELDAIRNAYVKSGNAKKVSAAKLDEFSNFEVWSYPMNTVVNGFYEPDLIPDKKMFKTTGEKKIYFIVTSAHQFDRISTMENLMRLITSFRRNVRGYYPNSKWITFLVGLDNFEGRDSHLFAELIKRQTKDGRSFGDFVRIFNYGTSAAIYQYKDEPFDVESRTLMEEYFSSFFSDTDADFQMTHVSTDTEDDA